MPVDHTKLKQMMDQLNRYPEFTKVVGGIIVEGPITIGDYVFTFSNIFVETEGSEFRKFVIMYVDTPSGKLPRLLYKSISAGEWKAIPCVMPNGTLVKCAALNGSHYTQENKLVPGISKVLSNLDIHSVPWPMNEAQSEFLTNIFALDPGDLAHDQHMAKGVFTYQEEIFFTDVMKSSDPSNPDVLTIAQRAPPGADSDIEIRKAHLYRDSNVQYPLLMAIELMNRQLQEQDSHDALFKFVPDMRTAKPIHQYKTNHTIFSISPSAMDVHVWVFNGFCPDRQGKVHEIHWHFAYIELQKDLPVATVDEFLRPIQQVNANWARRGSQHVWIDWVHLARYKVSTYGTSCSPIDTGAFTNKGVEYIFQLSESTLRDAVCLGAPYDYYALITPILRELIPIKHFLSRIKRGS